jgi:hypothetical protein
MSSISRKRNRSNSNLNNNNSSKKKPRTASNKTTTSSSNKKPKERRITFPEDESNLKQVRTFTKNDHELEENSFDQVYRYTLNDEQDLEIDERMKKQMNDLLVILFPEWFEQLFLNPEDVFVWIGKETNKTYGLASLKLQCYLIEYKESFVFTYDVKNRRWIFYKSENMTKTTTMTRNQALKIAKLMLRKTYLKSYLKKREESPGINFEIDAQCGKTQNNENAYLDETKIYGTHPIDDSLPMYRQKFKRPMTFVHRRIKTLQLQFAVPNGEQRVHDIIQRLHVLSLEDQKLILDKLDKVAQRSINKRMSLHDQILSGLTDKKWLKYIADIELKYD